MSEVTSPTTGFQAGQRVRLTAPFTGRCMTYQDNGGVFDPKPPRVLATGTVLTVFVNPTPTDKRLTNRCRKADAAASGASRRACWRWFPMPQFDARAGRPASGYRRDGKQFPEATVLLEIDYRIWRLTPDEARKMAGLLNAAAMVGDDLIPKESAGDAQGDRVG